MKILITGALGYIGALFSTALCDNYDVVPTSRTLMQNSGQRYLDITDEMRAKKVIAKESPDVIIHTAAMANLAACEADPKTAFLVNAHGTQNIVRAANEIGARVLFISTLAANNPNIVYGRSKLAAEEHIQNVTMGYEIVRLSMTFGLSPNTTSHRPFNRILENYKKGEPTTYDNVWLFQPSFTEHILSVIFQLLTQSFSNRSLSVTVDRCCTMYQIVSDLLGPELVRGEAIYRNREIIRIDPNHLSLQNLPTMTYMNMLNVMRTQLGVYSKSF